MKTTKQLIAKVLKVTAQELTPYNESGECVEYVFNALEFCNGLVMVPSDTTNDWFFASSEDVEPGGMAVVTDIEETEETIIIDSSDLLSSIQGSIREFGIDSVPVNHLELWK